MMRVYYTYMGELFVVLREGIEVGQRVFNGEKLHEVTRLAIAVWNGLTCAWDVWDGRGV